MPICLEFSTLKGLDNFSNVSSQNDLLQWWYKCVLLGVNRNVFKGLCTLGIIQGYFQSQVGKKLQQTQY